MKIIIKNRFFCSNKSKKFFECIFLILLNLLNLFKVLLLVIEYEKQKYYLSRKWDMLTIALSKIWSYII